MKTSIPMSLSGIHTWISEATHVRADTHTKTKNRTEESTAAYKPTPTHQP